MVAPTIKDHLKLGPIGTRRLKCSRCATVVHLGAKVEEYYAHLPNHTIPADRRTRKSPSPRQIEAGWRQAGTHVGSRTGAVVAHNPEPNAYASGQFSDERVRDVVDRLGGPDLLHEKRSDPEPRVTCAKGFVSGLVKPINLVALDEDVFPVMIWEPPRQVCLVDCLLSIQGRCTRSLVRTKSSLFDDIEFSPPNLPYRRRNVSVHDNGTREKPRR